MNMDISTKNKLLSFQKNEITEYTIYQRLIKRMKSAHNKKVLEKIAEEEYKHYKIWRSYTDQDVKPNRWMVWKYCFISRIFGFTFGVKLMESGEESAQGEYQKLKGTIPEAEKITRDEGEHEAALTEMLQEERLQYIGSIVLGLNDALVELTGALAGLTLALQNSRLIVLSASVTGIAAALSMGASGYLSTKAEKNEKDPLRSSLYTGVTYFITVIILILPFLLLKNIFLCLVCSIILAVAIIAFYNYYVSVANNVRFKERFLEMALLSLGIAGISFAVGFVLRSFLGVEV